MATQYTAGIVQGQNWTADIANQIGAAWETWTPTITPSAGAFTTITTNFARYGRTQKIIFGALDFTITSVGTASGVVFFTIPITARTGTTALACGQWRETALYGWSGIVAVDTTTQGSLRRYDNASYIAANERFTLSFQYEAA